MRYWISSTALTITLNALGEANKILASVVSNARIAANEKGVIDFGADGQHQTWPLTAYPTQFSDDLPKYVHVAIPRSNTVGRNAVVVFPSCELTTDGYDASTIGAVDNEGNSIAPKRVGSTDYWYVYLQGWITAPVSGKRGWGADIQYGDLGTNKAYDEGPVETDWYRWDKQANAGKGLVTFKKDIDLLRGDDGTPVIAFNIMRIGGALLQWNNDNNSLEVTNIIKTSSANVIASGDVVAFGPGVPSPAPVGVSSFADLTEVKNAGSPTAAKSYWGWTGTTYGWIAGGGGGEGVTRFSQLSDVPAIPTTKKYFGVDAEGNLAWMDAASGAISWDDLTTKPTQKQLTDIIGSYYLTQHQSLAGYATQQWVKDQGYLTAHQSLANYLTKTEAEQTYFKKGSLYIGKTPVLTSAAQQNLEGIQHIFLDNTNAGEHFVGRKGNYGDGGGVGLLFKNDSVEGDFIGFYRWGTGGGNILRYVGVHDSIIIERKTVINNTLKIGDATLSWDATHGMLKIDKGIYSLKDVVAFGAEQGSEPTGAQYLRELLDVAVSGQTSGQALVWNGTKWVNGTAGLDTTAVNNLINSKNFATKSWVSSQGFLTQHQSLAGYATQSWVEAQNFIYHSQASGLTVKGLAYTGTGDGIVTAYQTNLAYYGSEESWASYLIFNHHDGATYYHQMLRMPFWGIPQYQRQVGKDDGSVELSGWKNFITEENIASQTVAKAKVLSDYTDTEGTTGRTIGIGYSKAELTDEQATVLAAYVVNGPNIYLKDVPKSVLTVGAANKLASKRQIWGVEFDGTSDITNETFIQGGVLNRSYALSLVADVPGGGIGHGFLTGALENDNVIMFLSDRKRVGINNADPQYTLDVKGPANITGDLRAGNANGSNIYLGSPHETILHNDANAFWVGMSDGYQPLILWNNASGKRISLGAATTINGDTSINGDLYIKGRRIYNDPDNNAIRFDGNIIATGDIIAFGGAGTLDIEALKVTSVDAGSVSADNLNVGTLSFFVNPTGKYSIHCSDRDIMLSADGSVWCDNDFLPVSDYLLGSEEHPWDRLYVNNIYLNTSDISDIHFEGNQLVLTIGGTTKKFNAV